MSTTPPASLPNPGAIVNASAVLTEFRPTALSKDEKYKCVVCKQLMIEPNQTDCGHRGCAKCFTDLKVKSAPCPVGEEDCEVLTDQNYRPDRSFAKELQKIDVYCPNKDFGCSEQLKYAQVVAHLDKCVARQRPCPNNCGNKFEPRELALHQNICPKRPVPCPQCKQSVTLSDLEDHKVKLCPESVQKCPYSCGTPKILLKELDNHKANCSKRPVDCMFQKVGCKEKLPADAMKKHQNDCTVHWPMVIASMSEMQTKLDAVSSSSSASALLSVASNMAASSGDSGIGSGPTSAEFYDELIKMRTSSEELAKKLNVLERSMAKQAEMIFTLEDSMGDAAGAPTRVQGSDDTRAVAELQASVAHITTRIAQLEKLPGLEESGRVRQVENEITLHSVRIAEMDLRVQCLEAASFDGRLLWKITDYKRRKQEALQGKTMSLYSQPFYTSRFGYKMCARLYLNGDGMGKGTHLSLFFVVMRGEYDQLLMWPFKQKVTFFLVDQLANAKHVMDSFRPDPASTSFKRPTSDMNIASGCPLFAPQHTVEAAPYYSVENDCIFIRVIVDTSGVENL